MAAEYAAQGEPCAAQGAVDAQGLDSIFGAGGGKAAAGREEGRDGRAIDADGEDEQLAQEVLHRVASSLIMARSTRAYEVSPEPT